MKYLDNNQRIEDLKLYSIIFETACEFIDIYSAKHDIKHKPEVSIKATNKKSVRVKVKLAKHLKLIFYSYVSCEDKHYFEVLDNNNSVIYSDFYQLSHITQILESLFNTYGV